MFALDLVAVMAVSPAMVCQLGCSAGERTCSRLTTLYSRYASTKNDETNLGHRDH